MGGFFLVTIEPGRSGDAEVAALDRAFRELGFAEPVTIRDAAYILCVYPNFQERQAALRRFPQDGFAFACGTLLIDGEVGEAAAATAYEAGPAIEGRLSQALGHYCLVTRRDGKTELRTDRFGGYHILFNRKAGIVCSSFYALSQVLPRLTLTQQSACEYVFNGVVSGNATLFDEVELAPIGAKIMVGADGIELAVPASRVPEIAEVDDRAGSVSRSIALLDRYFAAVSASFGSRAACALSGGYDSRLILAMLRRHDIRPRVFVYGRAHERDVRVAGEIAAGEGFELHAIDKDDRPIIPPGEFAPIAHRNFLAIDGYSYTGIFNNGAEVEESANRVRDNFIAFNGGGGEIFRNFFYLIGHEYDLRALLWSFYSQFDPATCTERFDEEAYYRGLEAKMRAVLGTDQRRVRRTAIQWLYHNFRCRSWDGKVDSVSSRFGFTAMPYLERSVTEHGCTLPLRWRNHGAYEAAMIHKVDARLAAYPTNYGHDFSAPPPLARRLHDYLTYLRQPLLRRYTFRIKNRRNHTRARGGYLTLDYQKAMLPDGVSLTAPLFRLDRLANADQLNRVLSLEYLLQRLGSRVVTEF